MENLHFPQMAWLSKYSGNGDAVLKPAERAHV